MTSILPPFMNTGAMSTARSHCASRQAMRAYRQNHILARLPAREGDRLYRVDGISQLWFDDVETMRIAMESAEQRACIEDIQGFLSHVTILIQREGERRQRGAVERLPVKFVYLLAG